VTKLAFGESVVQLDKKTTWVKIKTSDTIGWIANTMIIDSTKAPKDLLDKINSGHKKQLEEKIAEEKKTQLLKEQQTKALLAKKKMLDAQLDSRGKAASHARDSVIQSAIVSDSLEKSKQKPETKLVEYHVYGRDPFIALSHTEDSPVPNVEDLNLVGILYDDADRIGLLEDRSDKSKAFAFRENDPVQNGYVLRIQPDKILFLINELGISRTYALKLIKNKE
jgi:hypothetical protein